MKTTYNLILAAFAAAMALSSCTKDIAAEKQDSESDGLRTIEISFETPTKTVLNEDDIENPQAVFKNGDKIMVSDGTEWEECTVTPSFLKKGAASFTTKLKGAHLQVVYPSKAATVTGGRLDKVKIPANQTGRFEDASIAYGTGGSQGIMLSPIAAILRFYVGPSIGVDSLVIEAKKNYLADGELDETGKQLSDKSVKKITIKPQGDEDVCYVAVNKISDDTLIVRSYTKSQHVENADGLVTRRFLINSLELKKLYNVFIPYYLEVEVGGGKTQKWGYCNFGALRPEEAGEYFAWGSTEGYQWNGYSKSFVGDHCFSWSNCPFNGGNEEFDPSCFDGMKDDVCPDGTLIPERDAASDLWKGGWRMPTKAEIDSLYAHVDSTWIGEKGLTIPTIDKRDLFFPLTGYGYYDETEKRSYVNWDDCGMYWTSSLDTTDNANAYCFNFTYHDPEYDSEESGFHLIGESFSRHCGLPIRPIFDPQLPQDISLELITTYTDGGNI